MRFFTLLDFQHWVLAVALGFVLLVAIYIAWKGYPPDRRPTEEESVPPQADEIPTSQHHPVAPLLVFIYAGTLLWLLGYLLAIGVFGGPIT